MGLNNPASGIFSAGEFVSSALPWVVSGTTSGTTVVKYTFPRVTKSITIKNLETTTKKLRVGFTLNGVNGIGGSYYFLVDYGDLVTLDVKVTELYLRADTSNTIIHSIYAGLTTISAGQMPVLTGTLGDGSQGWSGVG